MDELIRKSDAIEAIKNYALSAYDINLDDPKEFAGKTTPEKYCEGLFEATEIIENTETVDAVKVVRCKDCTRGFRKFIGKTDMVECQLYHHDDKRQYKDPMEFCSSGVRREEK